MTHNEALNAVLKAYEIRSRLVDGENQPWAIDLEIVGTLLGREITATDCVLRLGDYPYPSFFLLKPDVFTSATKTTYVQS